MFIGVAAHSAPTVSLLSQLPPRCNSRGDLLKTTDFSSVDPSSIIALYFIPRSVLWCVWLCGEDNVTALFQAQVGKCNVMCSTVDSR